MSTLIETHNPRVHTSASEEDLNNILLAIKSYSSCSDRVVKNLGILARQNKITLTCNALNYRTGYWDGEVLITLDFTNITMYDLVNCIISESNADEIHLNDQNTLRLWWD